MESLFGITTYPNIILSDSPRELPSWYNNLKILPPSFILVGANLRKIAIIVVDLAPEASDTTHSQIEKEIADSLQCDWIKRIEKVTVLDAR